MDSTCENTYNNTNEDAIKMSQVAANNRLAARSWGALYGMEINADNSIQYTISRPPGGLYNDVMKAFAYILLKEDKDKARVPIDVETVTTSPVVVTTSPVVVTTSPVVETPSPSVVTTSPSVETIPESSSLCPDILKKYQEYCGKIRRLDLVDCSDARSDFIENGSLKKYLRREMEDALARDGKLFSHGTIYTPLKTVKGGYKPIVDLYNKWKPSDWKPIFEGRFCEGGFEMELEDDLREQQLSKRYNDPNDLVRQVRWNNGKLESGYHIPFKPYHTSLLFDVLVEIWGPENVRMI
jgi:hypothetical protein